jgi:hypothetical protein
MLKLCLRSSSPCFSSDQLYTLNNPKAWSHWIWSVGTGEELAQYDGGTWAGKRKGGKGGRLEGYVGVAPKNNGRQGGSPKKFKPKWTREENQWAPKIKVSGLKKKEGQEEK